MVVRDNIHGDIEFTASEENVISSKWFQRLRQIKQLAFADYVFPGAVHNRFAHSLGCVKCITDMYEAVCVNMPSFYRESDLPLLRMMALFHDIGHAPFSHAAEELSTKEHEERLTEILELFKDYIVIPNDYNCKPYELIDQVYQGYGSIYMSDRHLMTLHSFMDGIIDADKLDYLARDALYCGVDYGKFDRQGLVSSLTTIDDELAITHTGVSALENFVLARYYMFKEVYFHPQERMMRMLYCEEMRHILKDGMFPDDTKKFLQLNDSKYIDKLKCVRNNPYILLYDSVFDAGLKEHIGRLLGDYLVCDAPRKSLFRSDEDDQNIKVINKIDNSIHLCTELSPVLHGIEFESIHKLRFYAHKDIGSAIIQEFRKVVKKYYEKRS